MEIKQNILTGEIEFVTYFGGDGYSAPVVYKKTFDTAGTAQEQMLYLHRDYQGSIVAITNDTGAVLEKRKFDAWGAIIQVQDGNNNVLNGLTILDRGYTGHEHLQSVGLINMNGRLYDPKLHRFLQPDNFVQDPSNTQNYNRYGYVLNNPLKYTDPSGEITDNCPTCPDQANNFPDGGGAGIIKSIKDFFSNKENVEWLTRNAGQAGLFIGKNINSALKDVGGFFKRLFGGGRKGSSGPPPNMATNVNMNPYTSGGSNSFEQNGFGQGGGNSIINSMQNVYNSSQAELRNTFDNAEITGGTMEMVGGFTALFSEGAGLGLAADGAKLSLFGTAGNVLMDGIEGKWDSAFSRSAEFGFYFGMGRAFKSGVPQKQLQNAFTAFQSYFSTYVMPALKDSWNKFNTPRTPKKPRR